MVVDLDTLFPNLSSFVQPKMRRSLNQCGAEGKFEGDYWNLESSCWAVFNHQPNWGGGGPHQFLKTLDEFIRCLPHGTPTRRIRDKICSHKESEFLDTVVEAAWALRFWTNGIGVNLEKRLDPKNEESKDADLVVTLDGIEHWLEATSIELSADEFPVATISNPLAQLLSSKDVTPKAFADKFAEKARAKYEGKFGGAVRKGLFQHEIIGILLCVFKSERVVPPDVLLGRLPVLPPQGLLDDKRPGLNLVWVHTLRPSKKSDILQPCEIRKWESL
jgi:hypothetical protein